LSEDEPYKRRRPEKAEGKIDLAKVARGIEEVDELRIADEAPEEAAVEPVELDEEELAAVTMKADEAGATEAAETEEPDSGEVDEAPSDLELRAAVEAVVFAADEPVTPGQVARAIGTKPKVVRRALADLVEKYRSTGSGISIEEIAGGFVFLTREDYAPAIRRLRKSAEGRKLTTAAIETLAVVAYKQPVQKVQIEDVRGVGCGPMLRTLMERGLVRIVGRAEVLGRPLLYGTTSRFLDTFGLASTKDLPKVKELTTG